MAIHQEIHVEATPDAIFDILTSSEKFAKMTGGRAASISTEVGGAATMFDGHIAARNVELRPGKRVVQAWRAKDWPDGVYSIVRFELSAEGDGARLVFDQVGHPDEAQARLESGWIKMYWEPMKAMVAAA